MKKLYLKKDGKCVVVTEKVVDVEELDNRVSGLEAQKENIEKEITYLKELIAEFN